MNLVIIINFEKKVHLSLNCAKIFMFVYMSKVTTPFCPMKLNHLKHVTVIIRYVICDVLFDFQ